MRSWTLAAVLTPLLWGAACGEGPRESSGSPDSIATGSGTLGLAEADSVVAAWIDTEQIAGVVLSVSHRSRVVLERAYGWSQLQDYGDGQYPDGPAGRGVQRSRGGGGLVRLDTPVPMTVGTRFDLASVTKVMATTFAMMFLVDRGRVDLDAPLATYLTDFRGEGRESITPRQLLTHRAGLQQWQPIYYTAAESEAAYRAVRDLPLGWPAGEGRHYSDLGFMLLGQLVETVSGGSLHGFLKENLYDPIGLRSTGFRPTHDATGPSGRFAATSHGNPFEYRMVHDSAFGYWVPGAPDRWNRWRRHTLIGEVNDGNAFHAFGGVAGHAGLFSTAQELQVLLELLLARGVYHGSRYLSSGVVDEFLAEVEDGQALGWQVPSEAPPGSFFHTGFTGTFVLGVPLERMTVVLLTNRQNTGVDGTGSYVDVDPLRWTVVEALLRPRP